MASNIVSTTIDATFPTPGVDNDTQGFRDNFSIIKAALAVATTEIGDLQVNTVKLNPILPEVNNFDGNSIVSAVFIASGDAVSPLEPTVANMELPWSAASYYAYDVKANVVLTITRWPASPPVSPKLGILGKMVVQVTADEAERTITFATANGSTIRLPGGVSNPVTLPIGSTNIYEFWTINGGTTVYGRLLGSYT